MASNQAKFKKRKQREKIKQQQGKYEARKEQVRLDTLNGKIIRAGDDDENLLYEKSTDYDVFNDEELKQAKTDVAELSEVLDATRSGVGLAGPQIGTLKNVVVWKKTPNSPINHMINPSIDSVSDDKDSIFEGCLSYPGFVSEVERPVSCTISYNDVAGKEHSAEFVGWEARILQHEIDHLSGICKVGESNEEDRKYTGRKNR